MATNRDETANVQVTTSSEPTVVHGSGNPATKVVTISTAPAVPNGPAPAAPQPVAEPQAGNAQPSSAQD